MPDGYAIRYMLYFTWCGCFEKRARLRLLWHDSQLSRIAECRWILYSLVPMLTVIEAGVLQRLSLPATTVILEDKLYLEIMLLQNPWLVPFGVNWVDDATQQRFSQGPSKAFIEKVHRIASVSSSTNCDTTANMRTTTLGGTASTLVVGKIGVRLNAVLHLVWVLTHNHVVSTWSYGDDVCV